MPVVCPRDVAHRLNSGGPHHAHGMRVTTSDSVVTPCAVLGTVRPFPNRLRNPSFTYYVAAVPNRQTCRSERCQSLRVVAPHPRVGHPRLLGMDNDFTICEDQADAHRRLQRALNLGGSLNAGDLLGANTRAHVTRPMTEPETARTLYGLRQSSTHRLWRALVKRCAETPRSLGFMRVEGGLRGLGEELGVDHTTLSRNLNAWETRHTPLVVTGHEQHSRARESLALIQIPLLTEWLLWTAEARVRWLSDQPGHLWDTDVVDIQRVFIPQGMPPPPDITRQDAAQMLLPAGSPLRLPGEALTGVDWLNRQRLRDRLDCLRKARQEKWRKIRRDRYEQREARRRVSA